MSTTNNVTIPNITPTDASLAIPDMFNVVWSLTRALKKAGWKYLASADGTTKDTTANPNADTWGALPVGTVSNAGAAAASITAVARGRATVTGLSGVVSADKGRFLQIGGSGSGNNGFHQIEEILSATSVKIDARRVTITAPDANNGALTWDIRDPVLNTNPISGAAASWWLAKGPSTIRIPITAASTGTFVRGENVTESTTGFEGEILGYVFDSPSSTGYLVVSPRIRGTGAETSYGLTTTETITGGISGATATHVGTALEYTREVVFWKTTTGVSGTIFEGTFEPVAEAADMFSTPAFLTAATATVPPGGGGSFPAHAYVHLGSSTTGTHQGWVTSSGTLSVAPFGKAQVLCADAIEEEDYSADGSWLYGLFSVGGTATGGYLGFGFQRLDDSEDGDVDPYASFGASVQTLYTGASRTNAGTLRISANDIDGDDFSLSGNLYTGLTAAMWRGWRARGLSYETFQHFEPAQLHTRLTDAILMGINPGDGEVVATDLSARVREPMWLVSSQLERKMRKGTPRWMSLVGVGNEGDLYDSKRLIQFAHRSSAMVVGPWDGTTEPQLT